MKKFMLWTCFFLILCFVEIPGLMSQNQSLADSLQIIYSKNEFPESERFAILKQLSDEEGDAEKQLKFSEELINLAREQDSAEYEFSGLLQKGNALRLKGDLSDALASYFEAAEIAQRLDIDRDLGLINVAIADAYAIMNNHDQAISHYRDAIEILEKENDSISVASALLNAGDAFFNHGELDSALFYFKKSGEIFETLHYDLGVAYYLGNAGLVYAQMGENAEAEMNLVKAVETMELLGDYYPISVYYTYMSDIYRDKGDLEEAMSFAGKSLSLAQKYGFKDQISDGNLKLYELYDQAGDVHSAFEYYKNYVKYKDSVSNISSVQEMANMRADYEVAQKQIEVDLLNAQKKNQTLVVIVISVALFFIVIMALLLYRRNIFIQRTKRVIEEEKNRSDNLLLNILPEETAMELKRDGRVSAKKFSSVTVLFSDFKGFTKYAENLPPEKLVEIIDQYFSRFDKIMEKYGIEKIKTIGDAYMAAGGLPFPSSDHAYKMVLAGLEMAEFVHKKKMNSHLGDAFDIRIGINTGPVVAGVVGTKKFAYDIWGDTVNIAARMESSSEPGKINISENTYELTKEDFHCEFRGELKVKNRGQLKMYFVNGAKANT